MSRYDVDLFAIGAGSGGVRASRMATHYGARVAVAEARDLGGTCVNVGCVPKKLMWYASHYREVFEAAVGFGWERTGPRFDWGRFLAAKDQEIARLNEVYRGLLTGSGVEVVAGRTRVVDPHTVEVDGRTITAEHILVAVGGRPVRPGVPGAEHALVSDDAFHLDELPGRLAVVGGGYIGVEMAGIFHGMGSRVTQLYRGDLFLRGFDRELRSTLAEEMRARGIELRFGVEVAAIERGPGGLVLRLDDGGELEVDRVLYAIGRRPDTAGLGLEEVGVELDATGAVRVDAFSRTAVPSIWAIGDVTDRLNLTPVAIHEGMCLASTLFGGEPQAPDHTLVPTAVFSQPPLATVGMTEDQAQAELEHYEVYCSRFRPLEHTLGGSQERSLMKLVVDARDSRVRGAHMLGAHAPEIIQGVAVAVKMGARKQHFDATIGIHPTSAEELVTLREPVTVGPEHVERKV
ncbi:MAG TPA: glutathione-disulfide reductase [Thermoanaerobaculia bacterium]|nr:glutathione-disulfide reductase [Thermoanaerobaculia bacterium]